MSQYKTIGFIGLGVMGEPICRNLVRKSGARVIAFDLAPEPLARLRAEGADGGGLGGGGRRQQRNRVPVPAQRQTCARGVRRRRHPEKYPLRADRGRSRHLIGQSDPRFRDAVAGQGRVMGRCADRAHASGRAGRHAERHGRRVAGIVCRDRAVDPLLCHRRDPLRRHRRGAGDKNPQQHGAVSRPSMRWPRRSRSPGATASIRRCCSIRCRRARPTALRCAITA